MKKERRMKEGMMKKEWRMNKEQRGYGITTPPFHPYSISHVQFTSILVVMMQC